ncbi:hypothetical protein PR048_024083 [Dryococelus australis]|uniref:Uncharacterized protein n=1 Tax=Dryococelus australis TaxID=614101 RepID=A0ABQ9GW19_9NEOP|nr:hypothetical protein PR048_024083 [Dryococelus australis]
MLNALQSLEMRLEMSQIQEQFSLCIRYVSNEDLPVLREDCCFFFPVKDLLLCGDLGLEMTQLVGQGYDGAANMCGSLSGVNTRIQELYRKAKYVSVFLCLQSQTHLELLKRQQMCSDLTLKQQVF